MSNTFRNLTLVSILATLLSPVYIQAQSTIVYDTPAADTYVSVSNPDTNYGSDPTWRTRFGANSSSQRLGYVRFDLDNRLTDQVTEATLSVTFTGRTNAVVGTSTLVVFGLNPNYTPPEGKLGLDWDELLLTNKNAPWPASGNGNPPAIVTLLGSVEIPVVDPADPNQVGTVYTISTPELAAFIDTFRQNNVNDITFIFRSTEGTFFHFASKENPDYSPVSLSITTLPEPGAVALIMGSLVACLIVYRRRHK